MSVLLIILAVTVQILVTPKISGSPIRIALSDLALPAVLAFLFIKWFRGDITFPKVPISHFWIWIGALSTWLFVSIIIGHQAQGHWSIWATINKGIGWIALLGYLLCGLWLASYVQRREQEQSVECFLAFAAVSAIVSIILFVGYRVGVDLFWGEIENYSRPRGFAENTNAYSIMLVAALVGAMALYAERRISFANWLPIMAMSLCAVVAFLAGSRSAFLGFVFGIVGLALLRRFRWKLLITIILLSGTIVTSIYYGMMLTSAFKSSGVFTSIYTVDAFIDINRKLGSDRHRLSNISTALDMWKEHPVFGIGLGTFYETQKNRPVVEGVVYNNPSVLHNTGIWILTETGIIGVILFASFFVCVAVRFFRLSRDDPGGVFPATGFCLMLVFMGASVGTEVLYQRYFWFLIGVFLAGSVCSRSPSGEQAERHEIPRGVE